MYNITQGAVTYLASTGASRVNFSDAKMTGSGKWVNIYDQGLVSLQQLNAFLACRPLGLLLCTLGILAGCVNIAVNSSLRRDAYVFYLTGISVADNVWFLSDWVGLIMYMVYPFSSRAFQIYNHYLTVFGSTVFQRSSIVLNCLASSERFLKLTFPFQISNNVLNRCPRAATVCVFFVSLLLNFSLLLEFEIRELRADLWLLSTTRLVQENPGLFLALRNVSRALLFYVPLIYLLAVNVALVTALKLHASKQQDIRATRGKASSKGLEGSKSLASKEKRAQAQAVMTTSRLVFILTFSFFLLLFPTTLNSTVDSFVDDYGLSSKNFYLYLTITYGAEWLVYLVEPCLFIVSLILSRQFRTVLLRRMHLRRCKASRRGETSAKSDFTRTVTVSREDCRGLSTNNKK